MALLELYPQVRHAHIGLVAFSGVLFALRGIGVLAGAGWAMRRPVRLFSQAIDTALLGAALLLLYLLQLNPFVIPWLATKLALLAAYIVLGSFALKRARSQGARLICFLAAVTTYLIMFGVARAHHPWGWLRLWGWA